jgi:DNA-binding CsgD family transcriptional regulator
MGFPKCDCKDSLACDHLIHDLYAGTLDESAWDRALIGIANWLGSSGALLCSVNPASEVVLRKELHPADSEAVNGYRKCWKAATTAELAFEGKLDSRQKWQSTVIFNDPLVARDTPYVLSTWLYKSVQKAVFISFPATCDRGPFEDSDARRLESIVPHIRRALEVRDRLEARQVRANTLASAIAGLQFGLFVLDSQGCILDAAGIAEELLLRDAAIRRDKDHALWLREPAGLQLRNLVRGATPAKRDSNCVFSLPRDNGMQSLAVIVTSTPAVPSTWTGADPRWLVFVYDPERRVATPAIIARELNISEREAEIAALLTMGHDLSVITRRLSISVHTTRSHLKHIFEKTGTRSQADLVRRILTSPAAHVPFRA